MAYANRDRAVVEGIVYNAGFRAMAAIAVRSATSNMTNFEHCAHRGDTVLQFRWTKSSLVFDEDDPRHFVPVHAAGNRMESSLRYNRQQSISMWRLKYHRALVP